VFLKIIIFQQNAIYWLWQYAVHVCRQTFVPYCLLIVVLMAVSKPVLSNDSSTYFTRTMHEIYSIQHLHRLHVHL